MTLRLLCALRLEVLARRPHPVRRNRGAQRVGRGFFGHQRARFGHRGERGLIGRGFGALRRRAHGLAGLQAGIPQQRQEPRQRIAMGLLLRILGQHQQIDIGLREQLAAAVTADREQRESGVAGQATRPCRADQRIDRRSARRDQGIDVVASVEAHGQSVVGLRQRGARRGRPRGIAIGCRREGTAGRTGGGGDRHRFRGRCRRRAGG